MDYIEKLKLTNIKSCYFYNDESIIYSKDNQHIIGLNLETNLTFFSNKFEKFDKFLITKDRIILMIDTGKICEYLVKIFDLKTIELIFKEEIIKKDVFVNFSNNIILLKNHDNDCIIINSNNKIIKIKLKDYEWKDFYETSFKDEIINNSKNYIYLHNEEYHKLIYDIENKVYFFTDEKDYIKNYIQIVENKRKFIIEKFNYKNYITLQGFKTLSNENNYKEEKIEIDLDFKFLRDLIFYPKKATIHSFLNNKIYILSYDGNKFSLINIIEVKGFIQDIKSKYLITLDYNIKDKDKNKSDIFDIMEDNKIYRIYKYEKVFSIEKQISNLFIKNHLYNGKLIIKDKDQNKKNYNYDLIIILFPIIKNFIAENQNFNFENDYFELIDYTLDEFDQLIDQIINKKEITNQSLYNYLGLDK